ncbi:hypothetical protein ACFWN1_29665 [Streptomyces sp. NPDC058459]|uniref:TetR/AcrR family transcriptional regulator n=1 Tax=Streptomyces sp. NPDC058459 TaxID=3346508 RepID=UPI0036643989
MLRRQGLSVRPRHVLRHRRPRPPRRAPRRPRAAPGPAWPAGWRDQVADPLPRIAFVPPHGDRGDIPRADLPAQVAARLTARLGSPDAGLRAELAVAALLGVGVRYGIPRGPYPRGSGPDEVADRYGPLVQARSAP